MDRLIDAGEKLGLKDENLEVFVSKQQAIEREESQLERKERQSEREEGERREKRTAKT